MSVNGFKLLLRNVYIRSTSNFRKRKINKTDFTIISNNCWGGWSMSHMDYEKIVQQ